MELRTRIRSSSPLVLHTDQLGSTRLVTAETSLTGTPTLVPLLAMDYNAYGALTTTALDNLTEPPR